MSVGLGADGDGRGWRRALQGRKSSSKAVLGMKAQGVCPTAWLLASSAVQP